MANESCRACGSILDPEATFCKNCGTPVHGAAGPVPAVETGPAGGQATPADRLAAAYAYNQMPDPACDDCDPLSVGQYLVMMLVTAIPLVGLIANLVWAFGGSTNFNRRNFAKAALVLSLIAFVLAILFGGLILAVVSIIQGNYNNF